MENVFNSLNFLEPKCPGCNKKIDYCVTTTFDESENVHVCNSCGHILD